MNAGEATGHGSLWKVYARDVGWFKARRDCVFVTFMAGSVTDASYEHFLDVSKKDLSEASPSYRVAILYDMRLDPGVMTPKRRQALGSFLARNRATIARTTRAYAFASTSMTARTILRGIHWLAPPDYPAAVVDNPGDGLRFIAQHVPHLDVIDFSTSYQVLVLRELVTLRSLASPAG